MIDDDGLAVKKKIPHKDHLPPISGSKGGPYLPSKISSRMPRLPFVIKNPFESIATRLSHSPWEAQNLLENKSSSPPRHTPFFGAASSL